LMAKAINNYYFMVLWRYYPRLLKSSQTAR